MPGAAQAGSRQTTTLILNVVVDTPSFTVMTNAGFAVGGAGDATRTFRPNELPPVTEAFAVTFAGSCEKVNFGTLANEAKENGNDFETPASTPMVIVEDGPIGAPL